MIIWSIDAGALVNALVPTMTIWREASGEGSPGEFDVAMVIRNRMTRRHQTANEVCLAPYQFSSMDAPHDPGMTHWPNSDDASFLNAFKAWLQSGSITPEQDPVKGADFYFADGIEMPDWAKKFTFVMTVGHHHFYRS